MTFFTVYVCFRLEKKPFALETLFFNFSYKLFNKYFSLPQGTFQFRVSGRKQAIIYAYVCHFHHFIRKL